MPHISKNKLSKNDFEKIYDQMIVVFDTAGNKRKSDSLLRELLTPTEKVMFAKRLAILCMIDDKISEHYISYILSVSPSTVSRISLQYEQNLYPYISEIIRKNKQTIWDSLEKTIRESSLRYTGRKRWAWLNELERKYNRKIMKD